MRARSFPRPARGHQAPRGGQAGFTLVELMVALSGGLFLAIVVFTLSRDVTRFYQQETRVAGSTLSTVSGFQRLTADLALAGHLSTGNILSDRRVCSKPSGGWPQEMQTLRAIYFGKNAAAIAATELGPARADTKPQTLTISGAINVPEVFVTRSVASGGDGTWQVHLDLGTASARRVGLSALPGAEGKNLEVMTSLFMAGGNGRIVRLRRGLQDQFVLVGNVGTNPGQAFLNLAPTPGLQRVAAGSAKCGISDLGELMSVSVVNIIRYDIRPMKDDPAYKALFEASGVAKVPFEKDRAELVRVELDPFGKEIDGTRELVAEYAVDLKFTAWRAASGAQPALAEVTTDLDTASTFNQLVRGVRVRFSTRSREADRTADVFAGSDATHRYRIPLQTTPPLFARVRTLQSDVPLRNLEGSNWD
jgi:hypothetical protein